MRPVGLTQPRPLVRPAGQAQGPHPAPHPPLVPTGRRQTFPLIPRVGWQKSSGCLFKRSRTFVHIEPCLTKLSEIAEQPAKADKSAVGAINRPLLRPELLTRSAALRPL